MQRPMIGKGLTIGTLALTLVAGASFGSGSAASVSRAPAASTDDAPSSVAAGSPASATGTDYWVSFLPNAEEGPTMPEVTSLSVASASSGSMTVTGGALESPSTTDFSAGQPKTVGLPLVAMTDNTDASAYHVTTTVPVSLYAENDQSVGTADATLLIPTPDLGGEYVDATYPNFDNIETAESAIVATTNDTTVTITPTATLGTGRDQDEPFTESLDRGQVYPIRLTGTSPGDFTGSVVTADHPIAVFGGHQCAQVPVGVASCGHLYEELPPTSEMGRDFVLMPTATRSADHIRMIGTADGTTVSYLPSAPAGAPTTFSKGQVVEFDLTAPVEVMTSEPLEILDYGESGFEDTRINDDPVMMYVPPAEQYLADYRFTTQLRSDDVQDYAAVSIPTADVGSLKLDGTAVDTSDFSGLVGTKWSTGAVQISAGEHRLTASAPFGAQLYGYPDSDTTEVSYGTTAGMNFARVADVASVTVTPRSSAADVGSAKCLKVSALDGSSAPVPNVLIELAVSGPNPASSFVFANSSGHATYCTSGKKLGIDTVTASVGAVSGEATISRRVARLAEYTARSALGRATLRWSNPNHTLFPTTVVIRRTDGTSAAVNPHVGVLAYSGSGTKVAVRRLGTGKSFTFTGWVEDKQGQLSAAVRLTLTGTRFADVASPAHLARGAKVTLSAVLRAVGRGDPAVRGVKVELERKRGSRWTVLAHPRTNRKGKASARVAVGSTTMFRWLFAGSGRRLGSSHAFKVRA